MDKLNFRNIQKKLKLTDQGVSDALGVELFTVQSWANGIWPVPTIAEKFLRMLLDRRSDLYLAGHASGYRDGFFVGYNAGFYDSGFVISGQG